MNSISLIHLNFFNTDETFGVMSVALILTKENVDFFIFPFLESEYLKFQYWPSRGTETYGVMSVTLTDTQEMATYVIRTFQLQRVSALNVSIPHHTRMWSFFHLFIFTFGVIHK